MTQGGSYPSFYVPDDGTRYIAGDVVRVDQSSRQARIVKDEDGDYEVIECRRAPELGGDSPMLRVNLRRRRPPEPTDTPARW